MASAIAAILTISVLALASPNQVFAQIGSNTGQVLAVRILAGQVPGQQAGQALPQAGQALQQQAEQIPAQKAGQVLGLNHLLQKAQAGKVFCLGEWRSVLGKVLVGQDHVPHVEQILTWQDHVPEHHNFREIVR